MPVRIGCSLWGGEVFLVIVVLEFLKDCVTAGESMERNHKTFLFLRNV